MADSLETGLILMATGMSTVFVLLALLVWLVGVVSSFCRWLEPKPAAVLAAPPSAAAQPLGDAELAGVIGAAIAAHRHRRSR
jgi:sodium pump decarboxylase gamma subunit